VNFIRTYILYLVLSLVKVKNILSHQRYSTFI